MANFKHLFEKGQLNRAKGFQQLKINSAAIDSPDHSETEQDISVNAQYEDKGRSYNCFNCTGAGHWPKECRDLEYDRKHNLAEFDPVGGIAWLGNSECLIHSSL
jgi:DNA primase large subunit